MYEHVVRETNEDMIETMNYEIENEDPNHQFENQEVIGARTDYDHNA